MTEDQRKKLLSNIIPCSYDYDRMIAYNCEGINEHESYDDFYDWNIKCILECSDEDYNFIAKLCSKISNKQINQMDTAKEYRNLYKVLCDENAKIRIEAYEKDLLEKLLNKYGK